MPVSGSAHGVFIAAVVENRALCREHYCLILGLTAFPQTLPGQFIQIACRDTDESHELAHDWTAGERSRLTDPDFRARVAFLRRPFSLAGRRDKSSFVELDIIHRVVGVGTDWMSRLGP
ncbi:MAG: hypothetical protein ACREJC_12875, partial [Tepidisphaeraceae bacterium]